MKWTGYASTTWEPLTALQDTSALDKFEEDWGDANSNDGPTTGEEEDNVTGHASSLGLA